MKSKTWFYTYFLLIVSFSVQGQFELNKNKIKLNVTPKKETPKKILPKTNTVVNKSEQIIKYEPSFFKNADEELIKSLSKTPKIGEIEKETFELRNNGEVFGKRINDLNASLEPKYISKNYGVYTSETDYIKILCRDFDAVDGDIVRILVNNVAEVKSCVLEAGFQTYMVKLLTETNEIDFMALNEGEGSPNTAEFAIYDENNKLIYSNQWALYEGYKARIVIMKK